MKKLFWALLILCCCAYLPAQQLTRFAVVDLTKVYSAFFRDSRAVREFEERSARVQAEIDRRTLEIQELKAKRAEAVLRNDQAEANRLGNQIDRMSEALKEYYETQNDILENQRRNLAQSVTFLNQVYPEIRRIAESEGYSLVFNLKESAGIIWYSPTVDITDKVIQNLLRNANR